MRYSVDTIILYQGKFVIIRRLNNPTGLALPGGGIEKGEDKTRAAVREAEEETGLQFVPKYWLPKVYDEAGRDPRGDATSYVAVGEGKGILKNEEGKTEVLLMNRAEVLASEKMFVFDHYQIFCDYLEK